MSGDDDFPAGRVPPNNLDAERSVLGAILLRPDVLPQVVELGMAPEDLYHLTYRAIFEAMLALDERRVALDVLTVANECRKARRGDKNTEVLLADLAAAVPTAANVGYYVGIVRECALRRRMIAACGEITGEAYDVRSDTDTFVDQAEARVYDVTRRRDRQSYVPVKTLAPRVIEVAQARFDLNREVSGVPCGLIDVDRLTTGFQPSDLILLAGRPSAGKTALLLHTCLYAAEQGIPCLIFSLEMSKLALAERLVCNEGQLDGQLVRTGRLGRQGWPDLVQGAARISELPLYIDDSGDLSPVEIRAKARRWMSDCNIPHREDGLVLIALDYLQLVNTDASRSRQENREQQVARVSRSLKNLAKELRVPVMALCQLSRRVEKGGTRAGRPQLSDLRESGGLEADADVVMFVHRPQPRKKKDKADDKQLTLTPEQEERKSEIILGKQRNGPTGVVEVLFRKESSRFESLSKREDEEGAA